MEERIESEVYERQVSAAERVFSRAPFSVVTMVARIKGAVSEELVRQAVAKAQQRHVLLRVRLTERDGSQWFTSDGCGEIPVAVVPRKSADDWIEIHAAAARMPFEFETLPAVRFILIRGPDASDLIILCHHTICDGTSLAYLARDIMGYMGDPSRVVEALPPPEPLALENLPADAPRFGLTHFLIQQMNPRWAAESVPFDQEDYEQLSRAYWNHYHHDILCVELSKEETHTLVTRCRDEDISLNSALTAAFCGAQGVVEGKKPHHKQILMAASVRDRLSHPPGEALGFFASSIELKLKFNHRKNFWENARRFHKQIKPNTTNRKIFKQVLTWLTLEPTFIEAMNVKQLAALVLPDSTRYEKLSGFGQREDSVAKFLRRSRMNELEKKLWGLVITNLGRFQLPTAYGSLELDRLIFQPGSGFPLSHINLVVGAVTFDGKLSLIVEYAREAIDRETVAQIKNKALEFLIQA